MTNEMHLMPVLVEAEIKEIKAGYRADAIKLYRERCGTTLKEAHTAIHNWIDQNEQGMTVAQIQTFISGMILGGIGVENKPAAVVLREALFSCAVVDWHKLENTIRREYPEINFDLKGKLDDIQD